MYDWFTVWKDNQSQNAKSGAVKAPRRNDLCTEAYKMSQASNPGRRIGENSLGKGMVDNTLQTFSGIPKW